MYNQNYKVELPQFPDREVSIAEYGAKSGDLQIETGRHNAEAINRAIREVSEQGGGTVRVPAGIWAVAFYPRDPADRSVTTWHWKS